MSKPLRRLVAIGLHRSLLLCSTVFTALLIVGAVSGSAQSPNPHLAAIAREARQAIAVIDWFYVRRRACPQPSRPDELAELRSQLGDGYSAEMQGQFLEIRGISMAASWLYYTSPDHRDHCTLWRKLGWDPALIWRREGNLTRWAFDPGDGSNKRLVTLPRSLR